MEKAVLMMAKKVLIVEDDSNIAELLNLYLEKEGFEPLVAKDGGKGVEQFRAFQPDLVLLDSENRVDAVYLRGRRLE